MREHVDEIPWSMVYWRITILALGFVVVSSMRVIEHIATPVHHQAMQFNSNPIWLRSNVIQTIGDPRGIKLPFVFPRRVKIEAKLVFTTTGCLSCWVSDNTGAPLDKSRQPVDKKRTSIVLRGWVNWDPKNPSTYHVKCKGAYKPDPYSDEYTDLTIHSYNVVATPFLK